jgi:hypothetical protein
MASRDGVLNRRCTLEVAEPLFAMLHNPCPLNRMSVVRIMLARVLLSVVSEGRDAGERVIAGLQVATLC